VETLKYIGGGRKFKNFFGFPTQIFLKSPDSNPSFYRFSQTFATCAISGRCGILGTPCCNRKRLDQRLLLLTWSSLTTRRRSVMLEVTRALEASLSEDKEDPLTCPITIHPPRFWLLSSVVVFQETRSLLLALQAAALSWP
jgi:hypothetical protein